MANLQLTRLQAQTLAKSTLSPQAFALLLACALCLWACQKELEKRAEPPAQDRPAQSQGSEPDEQKQRKDPQKQRKDPKPSPPDPSSLGYKARSVKVAVISDVNSRYGSTRYNPHVLNAVQDIVKRQPDLVLSPGDLVAGQAPGLDYAAMWKSFHYQIADVFFDHGIDFIWAPGNHDASGYPAYAEERLAYAKAWAERKPKAALLPGSRFPFYYAVISHDILIVALDHTMPFRLSQEQLHWLDEVLVQAQPLRAKIVIGHLPLEPVHLPQLWEISGSARLVELLQKHRVDFYLSGHHHSYYPGHLGELRVVSVPALGANPRNSFGEAVHAYLWMDFPLEGPAQIKALKSPDFRQEIDIKSLPPRLIQIQREDLGMAHYILELLDRQAQTP